MLENGFYQKSCFSNGNILIIIALLFYVMKNSTLYIVFCVMTGYEPLLYALEKAIMVKNHTAVKSGYVLYIVLCVKSLMTIPILTPVPTLLTHVGGKYWINFMLVHIMHHTALLITRT